MEYMNLILAIVIAMLIKDAISGSLAFIYSRGRDIRNIAKKRIVRWWKLRKQRRAK